MDAVWYERRKKHEKMKEKNKNKNKKRVKKLFHGYRSPENSWWR
jgi:hypothetical protein